MAVITISDGTFSKTVDTDEAEKAKVKRPYHWRKARRPKAKQRQEARERMGKGAVLSQATIDRLHREAVSHPLFIGMEEADVREYIDAKRAEFLSRQPFWYGHTPGGDARHRSNQRLYESRRDININTPQEGTNNAA